MKAEIVTIVKSIELARMKLTPLAGMTGTVIRHCNENRTPGAWVALNGKYLGESVWYIPISSILTEKQAEDKAKNELINMFRL